MQRSRRAPWAAAAVLVVAFFTAIAAPAARAGVPDSQLLRTYQPITHFDPLEAFGPTAVQSFIGDSALEESIGGQWVVVNADPGPGGLPADGGTYRLNQTSCSPSASIGGLSCYQTSWDAWDGGSVVYGRVAHLQDATVIQYWYFYYDDVYSYVYPPSSFIWQAHEGDWEVVNVVLSPDGTPLEAAYSQHCSGQRRAWATVPREGTHPVVYVALGSHANYFAPGLYQFNTECIPPAALDLLNQAHLPLPNDYVLPGGPTAGPPQSASVVTTIHNADEHSQAWLRFPGTWGEDQWFHASFVGLTAPLGASPMGPAFHDVWQTPYTTVESWPLG